MARMLFPVDLLFIYLIIQYYIPGANFCLEKLPGASVSVLTGNVRIVLKWCPADTICL